MKELSDKNINYNSKAVQRILYYFMEDTLKRVMENLQIQSVGKFNPNARWKNVGHLENTIRATIQKNAGGKQAVIDFFYAHYGRYVELAVQKDLPYGGVEQMTSKKPVKRMDDRGQGLRLAKPFLHSQIRRKLRHTLSELAKIYTYEGCAAFWTSVDNPDDKELHGMNERTLEQLRRDLFGK